MSWIHAQHERHRRPSRRSRSAPQQAVRLPLPTGWRAWNPPSLKIHFTRFHSFVLFYNFGESESFHRQNRRYGRTVWIRRSSNEQHNRKHLQWLIGDSLEGISLSNTFLVLSAHSSSCCQHATSMKSENRITIKFRGLKYKAQTLVMKQVDLVIMNYLSVELCRMSSSTPWSIFVFSYVHSSTKAFKVGNPRVSWSGVSVMCLSS